MNFDDWYEVQRKSLLHSMEERKANADPGQFELKVMTVRCEDQPGVQASAHVLKE